MPFSLLWVLICLPTPETWCPRLHGDVKSWEALEMSWYLLPPSLPGIYSWLDVCSLCTASLHTTSCAQQCSVPSLLACCSPSPSHPVFFHCPFELRPICFQINFIFFSCFASFPSKNIRYIAWKYRVIFYVREEQHFACHNYLSTDTDNCLSAPRWHEIAVNHVEYSIRTVPISSCSLSE